MSSKEILSQGCSFSALAKQAWNALKGRWGVAIGTLLLAEIILITAGFIPVAGNYAGLFLFPLNVGVYLFTLKLVRQEEPLGIGLIFEPFKQYWHYVWGCLRVGIFVFLWSLLLIIPGIIAGIRYSMTFYIMLDHPEYSVKEAMTESSAVMYGHKWQFFGYSLLLGLIFFVGTVCTFCIGLFWLIPWCASFFAAFYESVHRPVEPYSLPDSADGEIDPGAQAGV